MKLTRLEGQKVVATVVICEYEVPVYRIAQSMTGNFLSVSVGGEY